jgi:hypothetical protein
MKTNRIILAVLFLGFFGTNAALAQFSYRRTIGDETENQYQPGAFQAIKYRGGVISNPNKRGDNATDGNFTRHSRLGDSTGIGGSTLQTTSVTSESRPALIRPQSVSISSPITSRPNFGLRFESPEDSPALRSGLNLPGSIFSAPGSLSGPLNSSSFAGNRFAMPTADFSFGE